MVRKSDGGYGYGTTDLATIRYRIRDLKAERILYVVDARQALHFRLIFEVARRAGWLTDGIDVIHVAFGAVLGPDGRPFKTREGGAVKLMDLLDAAVARAVAILAEKDPDLDRDTANRIAEQAGIGAVQYAELATSRTKDYAFDVNRMVSFTGNTGGYLFDLAKAFTNCYEACPVLTADPPLRGNRLALCQLTAHTLRTGLGLLGITAPERM